MNAGRLPPFCDTALAELVERAEADLIAMSSEAARRRRSGAAGFARCRTSCSTSAAISGL